MGVNFNSLIGTTLSVRVILCSVFGPSHSSQILLISPDSSSVCKTSFQAKRIRLPASEQQPVCRYATLALELALAAFMYPHTLTGIFASNSGRTIRKNAILLPAYTLLLGLLALLGYMGHAANLMRDNANDVVPALFEALFSGWFERLHLISLGGEPFTVYIGLIALAANIAVAVAFNAAVPVRTAVRV